LPRSECPKCFPALRIALSLTTILKIGSQRCVNSQTQIRPVMRPGNCIRLHSFLRCLRVTRWPIHQQKTVSRRPRADEQGRSMNNAGTSSPISRQKEPNGRRPPRDFFVITQEDIRRWESTSIPSTAPCSRPRSARIDETSWLLARGGCTDASTTALVLITAGACIPLVVPGVY